MDTAGRTLLRVELRLRVLAPLRVAPIALRANTSHSSVLANCSLER
jgi:hypothetical protein